MAAIDLLTDPAPPDHGSAIAATILGLIPADLTGWSRAIVRAAG